MKITLYRKHGYSKHYITDYKNNIDYTHTTVLHNATIFDTKTQKDEIYYLKNTFGFDYKAEKIDDVKIQSSKHF